MLIAEFEEAYCSDILSKKKKTSSTLIDWTTLPYQEIITNDEGEKIPVVWIDGEPVYNRDFLEMERDEFIHVHKTPSAGVMFDRYTSEFEFIEGAEILTYYQNKAREEKARLLEDAEAAAALCE